MINVYFVDRSDLNPLLMPFFLIFCSLLLAALLRQLVNGDVS